MPVKNPGMNSYLQEPENESFGCWLEPNTDVRQLCGFPSVIGSSRLRSSMCKKMRIPVMGNLLLAAVRPGMFQNATRFVASSEMDLQKPCRERNENGYRNIRGLLSPRFSIDWRDKCREQRVPSKNRCGKWCRKRQVPETAERQPELPLFASS